MDVTGEAEAVKSDNIDMANRDNVLVQSACLEQEWRKMAVQLGDLCDGNRYIEYNKEIARLKMKLIHLQEEVDGYKSQNDNLSSLNNSLMDQVKDLISVQDNQLEQYSTALVLLTEERRELWQCLGASQKKLKNLEEKLECCKCEAGKCSGTTSEEVGINTDPIADPIPPNMVQTATCRNIEDEIREIEPNAQNITYTPRHLNSVDSSFSTSSAPPSVKNSPTTCKIKTGSFVNSMVEKLEKKRQLKSFDEPCSNRLDAGEPKTSEAEHCSAQIANYQARIYSLQTEVDQLKETCRSLTGLLERTYEEMQPTSTQSEHDVKDQLITCLRSRLLEAICDLVKMEKENPKMDVKSVACGSNYPDVESNLDLKRKAPPLQAGDPAPSPSKSKTSKILSSPASKLKALSEENYNKLKKLSCWKPRSQ